MHRIYVPAPYLPVGNTLFGVLVIYPVDVFDSFPITHSGVLTHQSVSFRVGMSIWSNVKCHLATHGHSAAALALEAGVAIAGILPGNPAGTFADPAECHFRRS